MVSPAFQRYLLALLLIVLVLPLLSCSDDESGPTSPPNDTLSAEGNVGPQGGTISSDDGRLRLTVPAGALAADTQIVITEVAAKDLSVTGEGMDVRHAFTMEPANLALAVPVTLELQYTTLAADQIGDKDPEMGDQSRVEIAVISMEGEDRETIRAIPEQTTQIGPVDLLVWQTVILSILPPELVLGTPVVNNGELISATLFAALGYDIPLQVVESTQFNAQVLLSYSLALTLASEVRLGPAALQNLVTLLEDGDAINHWEDVDPETAMRVNALISYAAGIPGPATWNLALRASFNIDAALAFPNSQNLPVLLGAFNAMFLFAPANLAVIEASDGHADLNPGVFALSGLLEAAYSIRGIPGFPYNNTLAVGSDSGTLLYSLAAENPAALVYSGFSALDLVTWALAFVGQSVDKSVDPASLAMVQAGPNGASLTQWFPEDNAFGFTGFIETLSGVTDLQPFDGDPYSGGIIWVAPALDKVRLLEYNPETEFWDIGRQFSNFPEAPGVPFTAAMRRGAGAVVVTEGTPGKIYHHDLENTFDPAVAIGDAGNAPRRIRTAGDLAFISNFESDDLTILSWSSAGEVSVIGSVPVGDGPVGIDALELADGTVAVVSTGFNDNTSTVTIVDATGSVISNVTSALPSEALALGHAFWLRGEATHYGVTCNQSGHLVVIDPGLD